MQSHQTVMSKQEVECLQEIRNGNIVCSFNYE